LKFLIIFTFLTLKQQNHTRFHYPECKNNKCARANKRENGSSLFSTRTNNGWFKWMANLFEINVDVVSNLVDWADEITTIQDFKMRNWAQTRGTWQTCSHVANVSSAVDCFYWNEFSRARYPDPDWMTKAIRWFILCNCCNFILQSRLGSVRFSTNWPMTKSNFHEIRS